MVLPGLPVIGHPQRSLFILLESVPVAAFFVLFTVIELMAILFTCYPLYLAILPEILGKLLHKGVSFLFKLPVYVFPKLFTKKKLRLEGEEESEELLYLDQPLQLSYRGKKWQSQCVVLLFATLAVMACCITALGFFRYFPVSISLECLEKDNNFNTLFCYTDTKDWHYWDLPLDCEEYQQMNKSDKIVNTDDSNSNGFESDVVCYALSLDIGKSAAIALGIYKILSFLVVATVFIMKIWVRLWLCCAQCCKFKPSHTMCCSTICYSCICFVAISTSGILSIIFLEFKSDLKIFGVGESYYRLAYCLAFFIPAVYFLYIPWPTRHYIVGEDTYSYLATSDEQMRQSQTKVNGDSMYQTN